MAVPDPQREPWTIRMKQAVMQRGMVSRAELIVIGAEAVPPGRGWHHLVRKWRNRGAIQPPVSDEFVYSGQRLVAAESLHQMLRIGTLRYVERDGQRWITHG